MTFRKWPSIESFYNVRRTVDHYGLANTPIHYRAKIKLHGTNAGIVIKPNGEVRAQKRTQAIATGNDNAGFAAWVESNHSFWSGLAGIGYTMTVYGEWCGPGIQKKTAIQQIPEKIFAIFAIRIDTGVEDENAQYFITPKEIDEILRNRHLINNVHVLPWYGDEIVIDFNDRAEMENAVARMNEMVAEVEPCDPWVKAVFGVEGIAEGLVFYPTNLTDWTRQPLRNFMFKAKGEKHKVIKTERSVQMDPEVLATVVEFVEKTVTEPRLEQALDEACDGRLDMKLIGPFIGWVSKDIKKETGDELEASGLEWRTVNKMITDAAKRWYVAKVREV